MVRGVRLADRFLHLKLYLGSRKYECDTSGIFDGVGGGRRWGGGGNHPFPPSATRMCGSIGGAGTTTNNATAAT